MRVQMTLRIQTTDFSSPLIEDVEMALRKQASRLLLSWYDSSLGRTIEAEIDIEEIREARP